MKSSEKSEGLKGDAHVNDHEQDVALKEKSIATRGWRSVRAI